MPNKIIDLKKVRQDKRKIKGWTMEEIEKRAVEERSGYKKLAENEPDALASGQDMSNILEEKEDD